MSIRTTIREITQDDLHMILHWRNHPKIRKFMLTQHEISFEEHVCWYSKARQDPSRKLFIVFDGQFPIGYVSFNNVSVGSTSEWGFYRNPDAPSGSGKILGNIALQHAFQNLELHKVFAQVIEFNRNSINFHLALGFQQEGVLREHQHINDAYHSVICYGLLNNEWQMTHHRTESKNVIY